MEDKAMTLMRKMNSMFPSIWDEFSEDLFDTSDLTLRGGSILPSCNVKETKNSFEVQVAAPGMRKEDFKVEIKDNVLQISSERKQEREDRDVEGNYMRKEFGYTAFNRTFTLPQSVKSEKISADYKDGVLNIHIPKKEEVIEKPAKQIQIA